jgi:hypothetical protein
MHLREAPRLCNTKKDDFLVFLKRLEGVNVVDHASEARLRRICEAFDTDVDSAGDNLVLHLTSTGGYQTPILKRVLSLGVRPDVPNSKGKLPLDLAVSLKTFRTAQAFALCRAMPATPDGANLCAGKIHYSCKTFTNRYLPLSCSMLDPLVSLRRENYRDVCRSRS